MNFKLFNENFNAGNVVFNFPCGSYSNSKKIKNKIYDFLPFQFFKPFGIPYTEIFKKNLYRKFLFWCLLYHKYKNNIFGLLNKKVIKI